MKDIQTNILGSAPRDLHANRAAERVARSLVRRYLWFIDTGSYVCAFSRDLPTVQDVNDGTFRWGESA